MKTLALGDIHGKTIWKDIIKKENPDRVIFLGDYVTTHEGISSEQQISNLEEILTYKEENSDKVILLRGNHEIQHLGYSWAECSGLDRTVLKYMSEETFKERFLSLTQWIYIDKELNTIFSHAGVSRVWLESVNCDIEDLNTLAPSALFGFTPDSLFDCYGDSVTQPPTWIRPMALCKCNISGYDQVVGHTPVTHGIVNIRKATKENRNIWLCDALENRYYLIIDSGTFIIKQYNDNEG